MFNRIRRAVARVVPARERRRRPEPAHCADANSLRLGQGEPSPLTRSVVREEVIWMDGEPSLRPYVLVCEPFAAAEAE
ncbi:hypothetical protein [Streptomyces sp. cg36]|uniref:hypothetical protein n=1 Tax=Streptomyces sp. cg36 TaxID=3238798 RepID=UPI0034E2C880